MNEGKQVLEKLKKYMDNVTEGPWSVESCGEKCACYVIGVSFHEDDESCENPVVGWLEPFDDNGNEISYYRSSGVACCEDGFVLDDGTHAANARYISACSPSEMRKLFAYIDELERENGEFGDRLGLVRVID